MKYEIRDFFFFLTPVIVGIGHPSRRSGEGVGQKALLYLVSGTSTSYQLSDIAHHARTTHAAHADLAPY